MRIRFILVPKEAGYVLRDPRGGTEARFSSIKDAIGYATKIAAGQRAELVVQNEEGKVSLEFPL